MTFAFDLDGTLNLWPALGVIMHELKNAGHKCIVLTAVPTGETREHRVQMLKDAGIMPGSYTDIVMSEDDGRSKAHYCHRNKVDVLVDDSLSNLDRTRSVSPNTCCLNVRPL